VIKQDGAAAAIIPAAGIGKRMGAGVPKQYLELNGRPLFVVTLEVFEQCPLIDEIILVVPAAEIDFCAQQLGKGSFRKVKQIVAGGKERQNSVANGLAAVSSHLDFVAVHDGVRPMVTTELIVRVIEAAHECGAAIPVLPVIDTLKKGDGLFVAETVDRSAYWRVQTPQCFEKSLLLKAYQKLNFKQINVTDDASLVEHLGQPVKMVSGEESNLKITTPVDLLIAEYLFKRDKL